MSLEDLFLKESKDAFKEWWELKGIKTLPLTAKPGTNGNIKVSNESNSLIKTYWRQRDQKFSLILIN